MSIRYEIEEGTNAVKVFYGDETVPVLYQPHFPSGEVWANEAEATEWAELYVASAKGESSLYAPNSRGAAGLPKPTAEEIEAMRQERKNQNSES